jgi:hypothetical protein
LRRRRHHRAGRGGLLGGSAHAEAHETEDESAAHDGGPENPTLRPSDDGATGRVSPSVRPQAEDDEEGLRAHGQVDDQVPVAEVPEIVRELDGRALAVGGIAGANLRPAGDTGLDEQAPAPARNDRVEQLDELGPFGTRPDDGHVAPKDVEQLRELVQVCPAQHPADARRAWVARTGPDRAALALRVGAHRPELVDREQLPALADPGLPEDDRPARRQRNEERDHEQQRPENDQRQGTGGEVEHSRRPARRHPLAEMNQAHEPRGRQVRHRHSAEGPLVEAQEPDDPEAAA